MTHNPHHTLYDTGPLNSYESSLNCHQDLEKAVSGASGPCRHFVWAKYPVLFIEDVKRRVEDGGLRFAKKDLRQEDGEIKIEDGEL